ncbi:MAG: isoprenylcysteine carboxylmethyltransferase family protein [Acidobacteriota bacterium]
MPADSRAWFLVLILAVVVERLVELVITQRNAHRLRARGGHPVGESHYPWMVALHTGLLIAAPAEVFLLDRAFVPTIGWTALATVGATMALRYWAITTLGDRWTTRVFVVPGEPPVLGGPYRFLRHPNYTAVILEVAALPLVHGAWWTALVGSVLNAFVLRTRIRAEESALEEAAGYFDVLGDRPRFVPR